VTRREFRGDPIDGTVQYITERPALEDEADDVVYATDPEEDGQETTENVPMPRRPDGQGQSTLDDWGWSA
jgi:hypothetical protein